MTAQETHGDLTIRRLCQLGVVSRAGYYRHFAAHAPGRAEADLREQVQRLSLAHRHYGYRRITAQLRREGHLANAKRVLRPMREDNLLCLRTRPFVPRTTDSRHYGGRYYGDTCNTPSIGYAVASEPASSRHRAGRI